MTSVELPESLTSLDDFAFYDCGKLISVYIEASTPPKKLGDLAFPEGAVFEAIYVPAESVDDYKTARGWREYADKIKAWPRTLTVTMPDADVTLEATFEDHRGGEGTCVSAPICEVCGAEYGEKDPDNHSYVDGVCTRCGAAEPDAGGGPDDPGTGSGGRSTGDSGDQDTAGGKDAGDQDAERADGTLAQTGDASAVTGPLLAMALVSFAGAAALRRDRG